MCLSLVCFGGGGGGGASVVDQGVGGRRIVWACDVSPARIRGARCEIDGCGEDFGDARYQEIAATARLHMLWKLWILSLIVVIRLGYARHTACLVRRHNRLNWRA